MELYVTIATKHTCTCSCTWTHTHLSWAPAQSLVTSGFLSLSVHLSHLRPLLLWRSPPPQDVPRLKTNLIWRCRGLIKPGGSIWGQGRGEEIWYLPQPSSSSSTYTYTPFYSSNLNPIHSTPTSTDKDILLALFSFFSVNQTDDSSRVEVEGMDNK